MRIAVLGRTRMLLDAARRLVDDGHQIPVVMTGAGEAYYTATPADFEAFAKTIGAEFFLDPKINAPDTVAILRRHACDVALSINWRTIVGAEAIGAFRHGIINGHLGDLPRYRGNACGNWAILRGEPHVGLSLHWMEADRLDSGDVLARRFLPLSAETYIDDIYEWMDRTVPVMAVEVMRGLANGSIVAVSQHADGRTPLRCFPRRPEDGRIDWKQDADAICALVRASSRPLAGAFCVLEGTQKVIVWRARPHHVDGEWAAVPGQVMFAVDGDPVIACGRGALRLTDIEIDGGTGADAARREVLRSTRQRLT